MPLGTSNAFFPSVVRTHLRTSSQGKSHALALSKEGATVIITDLPSETGAGRSLVDQINSSGSGSAAFMELDVTDENQWQKVAAEIEKKYTGIDVMINNAGAAFAEEAPDEMNL